MQWRALFQKEVQENWQNKKWVWVPLVIILLTIMDPLSYYYLPQLIDIVGGVPEGSTFDIPEIPSSEIMMMSLSQLSLFGVLIICLLSMGTISGERKSGITEIILVKPISTFNYISAKWCAYALLVSVALFIGLLTSWYYINILYDGFAFVMLIKLFLFYLLWFLFVLTLSFFYNTVLNSPGLVLASTVITLVIMNIFNLIFGHKLTWFPNNLSSHIQEMVAFNEVPTALIGTASILIVLILGLLILSIFSFHKREKVN